MKRLLITASFFLPLAVFSQSGTQPVKQNASVNNKGKESPAAVETSKEEIKVMRMSASRDSLPLQPVPAPAVKNAPVAEPKKMSSEIGVAPR